MAKEFRSWDVSQVGEWMRENGFGQYAAQFCEHHITGDLLPELNYTNLRDIGVKIVGDRARILQAVSKQLAPTKTANPQKSTYHRPKTQSFAKPSPSPIGPQTSSLGRNIRDLQTAQNSFPPREIPSNPPVTIASLRNQQRGAVKPLVIHPRSSSIKDKERKVQDLADAVNSVFGASSKTIHNSHAGEGSMHSISGSLNSLNLNHDAVSPLSKEECIRVFGLHPVVHVIKVTGLSDARSIRDKVFLKFNIRPGEEFQWQLLLKKGNDYLPVDDQELWEICKTDNEYRTNLHLRKETPQLMTASSPTNGQSAASIAKLQRIFGEDIIEPGRSKSKKNFTIQEPKTPTIPPSPSKAGAINQKLLAFFGERPPDELLVDQLEQFFPGLGKAKDPSISSPLPASIRNIVKANLDHKRSSKRMSVLAMRKSQGYNLRPVSRQSPLQIITDEEDEVAPKPPPISLPVLPENEELDLSKIELPSGSKSPVPLTIRWEQGQLIGQGAFGKVYHALNLDTGDFMAVKAVNAGMDEITFKKSSDSLKREIDLLADLQHENIVQYLGFEAAKDTFNVFLEYVSGGSISSCLAKCGKFSESITQNFTTQILIGLEYLHARDIIHRDIKGANIYEAYHRMTRMSIQGTMNWMAPEVARGKGGYSAKVDIWSCGALVLEMLTGHVPWHKVRGNIIYLLGTGNAPPVPASLSDISKSFLKETFAMNPEERPTATSLLDHVFTDIDPAGVDFQKWSLEAMQNHMDGSSEDSDDDSDDESDDESDFDSEEDDKDGEDEEVEDEEENIAGDYLSPDIETSPVIAIRSAPVPATLHELDFTATQHSAELQAAYGSPTSPVYSDSFAPSKPPNTFSSLETGTLSFVSDQTSSPVSYRPETAPLPKPTELVSPQSPDLGSPYKYGNEDDDLYDLDNIQMHEAMSLEYLLNTQDLVDDKFEDEP